MYVALLSTAVFAAGVVVFRRLKCSFTAML